MILYIKVELHRTVEAANLSNKRPVHIFPFNGIPHDVKVHQHDFHSIILATSGRSQLLTEAPVSDRRGISPDSAPNRWGLERGSVVLGIPGVVRKFQPGTDLAGLGIFYLTEWLVGETILRDQKTLEYLFFGASRFPTLAVEPIRTFSVSPETQEFLIRCLHEIESEYQATLPSLFEIKLIFLRFLHRLVGSYEATLGGVSADPFRAEIWAAVNLIEKWVQEHRDFDARELSRGVGCSAGHLYRIFATATGLSPTGYFQRRRMQAASQILLDSDSNLTEIAFQIGCSDSAHFSRLFKREMKTTPSAYRKRFRAPIQ